MTALIDFDGIKKAALCNARSLLRDLIPGGQFRSLEYIVRNPARADKNPGSFLINYRTGQWGDFATGAEGGDVISWYAHARGLNQSEAAGQIAERLGVPLYKANVGSATSSAPCEGNAASPSGSNGRRSAPLSDNEDKHATLVMPVPTDAPAPPAVHPTLGRPTRSWPYKNAAGDVIGYVRRFDEADHKTFRPLTLWRNSVGDRLEWRWESWPLKRPLYGLQELAERPSATVVVCEGEKSADAARRLLPGFVVVTSPNAGKSADKADWSQLCAREVIIWPDADIAGQHYAQAVIECLTDVGAKSVSVVSPPSDVVEGWDAANALDEGWRPEHAAALIDDAVPAGADSSQANSSDRLDGSEHQLVMRCMADVQPEKIEWLWPRRIAVGKQTLIGGEPGLGKSQVTAALAATVTTGGDWPCGEGRAPLGSVIILSAEDDASDTIRPRLDAAGADVNRVHQISAVRQSDGKGRRTFNLQADLALLEDAIKRIGDVRLVIIDPVSSYLGKTDSHKNAEVRGTLEPLGDMASRLRVAVVSVTHFSKGANQSAVNSFIGSIAFIAAARAAFIVTRDPDTEDDTRRLFVQAKNNIAADSGGLAFRVEQRLVGNEIVASSITWETERITRTADEILAAGRNANEAPERSEAEDFLRDILSGGSRPATEVEAEAKGAGVSWRTVRRAQKSLGIKPYRRAETGDGLGKAGRWYWALPNTPDAPKMANFPYGGHVSDVATLGDSGHLRGDGGRP